MKRAFLFNEFPEVVSMSAGKTGSESKTNELTALTIPSADQPPARPTGAATEAEDKVEDWRVGLPEADMPPWFRPARNPSRALSLLSARGFRTRMIRWRRQLNHINALEPTLKSEDDASLKKRSLAIRYRAMAGEKLPVLLPEAYALVREAGRRSAVDASL